MFLVYVDSGVIRFAGLLQVVCHSCLRFDASAAQSACGRAHAPRAPRPNRARATSLEPCAHSE
jgi:hypothetical protein